MEEKPNDYFRILQSVQSSQQFSWISVCTAVIFSYLPLWRVPRSQECSLFHPLIAYGNCRIFLFHFPFRLRFTLFCSVGKKRWVRIMWRKWTCHGDFLAGCSDCGKILPLMRFNARFTIQSAAVRDAEREKSPGLAALSSLFLIVRNWHWNKQVLPNQRWRHVGVFVKSLLVHLVSLKHLILLSLKSLSHLLHSCAGLFSPGVDLSAWQSSLPPGLLCSCQAPPA